MHELAVCQALMSQVDGIAREQQARRVVSVQLGIGPLSGVEAELLRQAFPIASAGSLADGAALHIDTLPVTVHCEQCGLTTTAVPNRLVCGQCGNWRTTLASGDELLLVTVELERDEAHAPVTQH